MTVLITTASVLFHSASLRLWETAGLDGSVSADMAHAGRCYFISEGSARETCSNAAFRLSERQKYDAGGGQNCSAGS